MSLQTLQKLGRLPVGQAWRLLAAWFWLLVFDLALRGFSLPRIQGLMIRPQEPGSGKSSPRAESWLWAVHVAARHHLYPMNCLQRSLTLQFLLARLGHSVELRIGVRREDQDLQAHAWLEQGGRPLNDPSGVIRRYDILTAAGSRR